MLKLKLKGGALYIAIIISIVIGVILSAFILIAYFNQKQVISKTALDQLNLNIESAFSIARSESFSPGQNNVWKQSTFNEDSIRIKKLQWGAYNLVVSESKNRHQYVKRSGIFGMQSFKDTALMVADVGRPINLAGKIKFSGNCYLPKAGYKTTYIEGSSFMADGNISASIKQAPSAIPGLSSKYIKELESCVSALNPNTDSIVSNIDAINNPFSAKTAVFQSGSVNLQGNILKGNVKLISTDKVVIEKTAKLDNILIIAKKVFIRKDFVGTIQVIASDTIVVEENCILNYPSSLVVFKKGETKNQDMSGVFINDKCKIEGAVLAINENPTNTKVMVAVNKECEIYGLVYSSNYLGVQGKVFGNVLGERLLLKTPSAVYENHLLNAELDSKKHCNSLVIPAVFEKSKAYRPVKWL